MKSFTSLPRLFTNGNVIQRRTFSSSPSDIASQLKIGRLNHVAIAVGNIKEATALYRDILGGKVSEEVVRFFHIF